MARKVLVFASVAAGMLLVADVRQADAGLLRNLMGYHSSHGCCEPSCCEPSCCEPACCEPCDSCCDSCCEPCCKKRKCCLARLRDMFRRKKCCNSCCDPCCCEPACCEPACCEPEPCCCCH